MVNPQQSPWTGRCGHHHDDPLDALACGVNQWLCREAGKFGGAQCAVILSGSAGETLEPHVSWYGNAAGAGSMLHAFAEAIVQMPRPEHCETCRRAWDGARAALDAMNLSALGSIPNC